MDIRRRKTTTIKLLTGQLKSDGGEIHILKDCSHIYEKPQNQEDLYKTITAFIDNIKNESNY